MNKAVAINADRHPLDDLNRLARYAQSPEPLRLALVRMNRRWQMRPRFG